MCIRDRTGTKPVPSGTVSFDLTLSDINKPVVVEVPADAQPLPQELSGGLL